MPENDYAGLAAAFAKAQAAFPAINRDKEVTVQTKAGGSYKFKYAPLDTILAAVRKPLADNGLSIIQLLDDDTLVTTLLHESGAMLSGRTPIPASEGIQAFGSAITYLRRYAIQALLGIAAEEDDDGNRAAGNRATFGQRAIEPQAPSHEATTDGGLIGTAAVGEAPADYQIRMEEGGEALSFKLMDGRKGFRVVAKGPLAIALSMVKSGVIGQRVTCWGRMGTDSFQKGTTKITYNILDLDRIQTAEFTLPAESTEPDSLPLFDPDTEAELDAAATAA